MPSKLDNIKKLINTDISLDGESHIYTLNDELDFNKSVTDVVDSQFPPFEREKIARILTIKVPKYQHLTADELLQEWRDKRDHGSLVHTELENYIKYREEPEELKSIAGKEWIDSNIGQYGDKLFSEVIVYSEKLNIAGMIDLLVYNSKNKKCYIFDWKTSKEINYTGKKNGITQHTNHIKDGNYNQYSLQLSMYAHLLEKYHGIKVNQSYITHLSEYETEIIEIEDFSRIAINICHELTPIKDLLPKKDYEKLEDKWGRGLTKKKPKYIDDYLEKKYNKKPKKVVSKLNNKKEEELIYNSTDIFEIFGILGLSFLISSIITIGIGLSYHAIYIIGIFLFFYMISQEK